MIEDYEKVIEEKGVFSFVPSGISMWPTLKNSAQTVVIAKKEGKLNLYDVALYKNKEGSYVLHRVVGENENGYIFSGDSLLYTEEGITDNMIVGVMIGYYKKRKFISSKDKNYSRFAKFLYRHNIIRKFVLKFYHKFLAKKGRK